MNTYSTGGMTMTGKNQSNERNPCPSVTLYTIKPTRNGPRLNLGIFGSISHGMTPQALCKWYNTVVGIMNVQTILTHTVFWTNPAIVFISPTHALYVKTLHKHTKIVN